MTDESDSLTEPRCGASELSPSLVEGLLAGSDMAWRRMVELYHPAVYRCCRGKGLSHEDALDVVNEVFSSVAHGLASLRKGTAFRAWVFGITRHKITDVFRRRLGWEAEGGTDAWQSLQAVPSADDPSDDEALAGTAELVRRGLELVRAEFETATWQSFWKVAVEERPPDEVAAELGISRNAVYLAKSRVLRRLREVLGDPVG